MRRLYDAKCINGHVTEVFGYADDPFRCGECGSEAKRIISPVRTQLEGTSGDFPSASDKWARMHVREANRKGND
jgi:hypothetical protein